MRYKKASVRAVLLQLLNIMTGLFSHDSSSITCVLSRFLDAMDLAYAAADIVVSRAGAMACTEILTTGKPSILIPSPQSTDGHQYNNAYIMADIAGSKVIADDELNSRSLHIAIDEVLGDENLMSEMTERSLRAARPNASEDIAKSIFSIVDVPLLE